MHTFFHALAFFGKALAVIFCLLSSSVGSVSSASAEPDPLDEPINADILDEPIGADTFDAPIGSDILEGESQDLNETKLEDQRADTAQESNDQNSLIPHKPIRLKTVTIIGNAERVTRVSGSAHQIKEKELEEQNYDDVHRVLKQVPGVYVRDEDGLGLRPNIGLRGANSDRSAKVTLMEDGVLMAPAPYSAPAAYYFPLTTRLTAVEVYKGPASIQYGPQTIGGALNMATRSTPLNGWVGALDSSYGQYNTSKVHSYIGWGGERFGVLLEGINLQSDGFKTLDGGGNTGFDKSELMFKGRINNDPNAENFHQVELKLGWAIESSNETYLGLSQSDFEATPYRRYLATQLANMSWDRLQGKLDYQLAIGDEWDFQMTAYRHHFARAWEKMIGFNNSEVSFEEVLANPTSAKNKTYYRLLTGEENTLSDNEKLRLGLNDRSYLSQGIQLKSTWRVEGEGWGNQAQVGLRFHQDQITRDHSDRLVSVQDNRLKVGESKSFFLQNKGETAAVSAYLFDELRLGDRWRLTPGIRAERYETLLSDRGVGATESISGDDFVLLPGIGAWYTLNDHWGLLAGVHKGFSPLSLSQTGQSDPEQSINYEAGTRWRYLGFEGEFISFLNDYENLVGTCTQSAGCRVDQLDQQFNAGSALIYGTELVAKTESKWGSTGRLLAQISYTYTHGRFSDDFQSGFSQWGTVETGDALPYIPEHQANLRLTWTSLNDRWGIGFSDTLVSSMLDSAGVFGEDEVVEIPGQHILDANVFWNFTSQLQSYLTIDNILNSAYMTSRRPFGSRPGKPLLIQIGARYTL